MKMRFLLPVTLVVSMLVWMALSWPLPLHVASAVTVSSHGGQDQHIRYMIPSDTLQLIYYYQLVKEWFAGTTPWFYNLYEFNTGNDAERYFPGGYYAPFSLFYALGSTIAGQAFGLNLAVLLSLWFTMLGTWLLLRRFVTDEWIAALFSTFVLVFPYRWITQFDSSPTGFAMMWVPALFLGLHMAVRDGSVRGGLLAAATLLLLYVGDVHVFFFSMLAMPAWCLLTLMAVPTIPGSWPIRLVKIFQALIPVGIAATLLIFAIRFLSASLDETAMSGGRSIVEVALFSPTMAGFFSWQGNSISSQVYIGWPMTALLLCGGLVMFGVFLRCPRQEWRPLLLWTMLLAGIILAAILALGPHGLRHGGLFGLVREIVPPYAMIRQAGKIFCLMPTLLAVAGSLALCAILRVVPSRAWWRPFAVVLIGTPIILGYISLSSPALTYLRADQAAYQAVVDDARAMGREPHALVVSLWPGDSHFASLYQHYALAHRMRIINGYSPAFTRAYFENVFLQFHPVNQGYLDDGRIENLLAMGIGHILLHEDLYPEKVAPFPVTFAIKEYLNHPRLRFLRQAENVWAFRLLPFPEEPVSDSMRSAESWKSFFPARHWEMEHSRFVHAASITDPMASSGGYLRLDGNQASVTLSRTGSPPAPSLRWMVRIRGEGRLLAQVFTDADTAAFEQELVVDHDQWGWMEIKAPLEEWAEILLHLRLLEGSVDLDSALLTAGQWTFLEPGQSLSLPGPSFFHAGYTDLKQGRLVFRKDYEEKRIIFYGPKMPVQPGHYKITLDFQSDEARDVVLGIMHIEVDWNRKEGPAFEVVAGHPFEAQVKMEHNLPLNVAFVFFGQADMTISKLELTRLE